MATPTSPVIPGFEPEAGDNIRSVVIAEHQPEYLPLPALILPDPQTTVLSRWQLSQEDVDKLLSNGGNLWLWVNTFGHGFQPTLLTFEPPTVEGRELAPPKPPEPERPNLQKELAELLNRHSKENGSHTPDFVLADYLLACLVAFDAATVRRESWYGREMVGPGGDASGPVIKPLQEGLDCGTPVEDESLLCPPEFESATGHFDPSGPIGPHICAGCGCDREDHLKRLRDEGEEDTSA